MSRGAGNSHSNFPPKPLQHLAGINFIIDVKSIETQNNVEIIEQQ